MTEKPIAHSKVKPKLPPASVAVVTVPGPMKAAAIIAPGPKPFTLFAMRVCSQPQIKMLGVDIGSKCIVNSPGLKNRPNDKEAPH
jgi:hypothetical protein